MAQTKAQRKFLQGLVRQGKPITGEEIEEFRGTLGAVKISEALFNRVRGIAKREGFVLGRLVDRLIEAGLETEWREQK
jgi:hypothetical protein